MRGHNTKKATEAGPPRRKRTHLGGWSDLGEVDLDTGVPAAGPVDPTAEQHASFPDGNNVVGTISDTGVPTGLPFKSALKRRARKHEKASTDSPADGAKP